MAPALVLAGLAGCASLPEYHPPLAQGSETHLRLVGAGDTSSPEQGQTDLLRRHAALVRAATGAPLIPGNEVSLLVDGPATYAAIFQAIEGARDHINLETFVFDDDTLGRKFADALIQKQAAGVQVNIIYDPVGSWATPQAFFQRMAEAGIAILPYRPVEYIVDLAHRDHRKMVIVDGRIAFTGGANIMAVYGSSSRWAEAHLHHVPDANTGWRDTDIEIRGPAVADFQRLFLETWRRQHGSPLAPRCYFPALHREGDKTVAVIGSGPGNGQSRVYFALLSAIANAADSIHITMAYFVPDRQLLQELIAAARRGVEVTLILPGITDHASILAAARAHYAELLAAGVRIYEERDFLLHAKTAVIDGVWSTVGSANMDFLSFLRNDELNAVVLGGQFGRQMEAMFQADLRVATLVNPETWAERSVWERLMESCATAVGAWL